MSSDAWKSSSLAYRSPEELRELSNALEKAEQTHTRSAANPMRLFSSARANLTGQGQTLEQVIVAAKSELVQAANDKAGAAGRIRVIMRRNSLDEAEQQELSNLSKIACFGRGEIVPGVRYADLSLEGCSIKDGLYNAARHGNVDVIAMLLRPENQELLKLAAKKSFSSFQPPS